MRLRRYPRSTLLTKRLSLLSAAARNAGKNPEAAERQMSKTAAVVEMLSRKLLAAAKDTREVATTYEARADQQKAS